MTAVAELAQPRKLYPRWIGHGDLLVIVDHPYTYVSLDQLEELTGIPRFNGDALIPDSPDAWPVTVPGAVLLPVGDAIARCQIHGTARALEFVTWLQDFLASLDDTVLDKAHQPIPFIHALTVKQAADDLDRDPAISMGRDRLFTLLEQLEWIERNSPEHDWVITALAHRADWLTLRAVRVPAPTRAGYREYLQVHVTRAGLTELRRILHAQGRGDPPDEHVIEPLF